MEVKLSQRRDLLLLPKLLPKPSLPSHYFSILDSKSSIHKRFRGLAWVQSILLSFLLFLIVFFFSRWPYTVANLFIPSYVFCAVRNGGFGFRRCWRLNTLPSNTSFMLSKSNGKDCEFYLVFLLQTNLICIWNMPISGSNLGFWLRLRHAHFGFCTELMLSVCGFYHGDGSCWLVERNG